MSEPLPPAAAYREQALACLRDGDGLGAHRWVKGWIGAGGGPHIDPWLADVACDLLRERPRNAVLAIDLAIGTWLPGVWDRAAMLYVRGVIVFRHLDDPKTALLDLDPIRETLPGWLEPLTISEITACEDAAPLSRKRKAAVANARPYLPPLQAVATGDHAHEHRADGDPPDYELRALLTGMGVPLL
jgi:hypothetical protein